MPLDPTLYATLKTHIDENANTVTLGETTLAISATPVEGAWANVIADWYNLTFNPDFRVYRSFVPLQEILGNTFDWTRVDNLSVGKARIWDWMKEAYAVGQVPGLNFAKPQCRVGINTVWIGTQADLDVRAVIYTHGFKLATRGEYVLRVANAATGAAPNASGDGPGTLQHEGILTGFDIYKARGGV